MLQSNLILLAIIVTSLATYVSRFSGVITSEKVSVKSKTFQWFNCVAYSTLAALLSRMVIFPAGILGDSSILSRFVVLFICVILFVITKKNLVLPTVLSAILLAVLTNF
tara:strand:+ start:246 stop:572 length:327 start_codon:yes stop_codon:yes gene_type:complete